MPVAQESTNEKKSGYAPVNGLRMYYEIEGSGRPLVYIPPAFCHAGVNTFPTLLRKHRILTPDLQGHGRTADLVDRPLGLEQHARDVVALMKHLGIQKADFFGESYGGVIATIIAVRHPEAVGRVATYAATFGPAASAVKPEVLNPKVAPTPDSRGIQFQRENYKQVAPDPEYWPKMWVKVGSIQWGGFAQHELAAIKAPFLIALGDRDFVRVEHALDTFKIIPNAQLAVIPDAGHFTVFSSQDRVMPVVENFLEKPEKTLPIATAETGYHPGETR